ncbi:P-loop containing nucleoside triphosphate hydrolase protein [Mycena belliarum]|uniref:P-loop containing nucleoside triphosphate hydrolase protein n=1 Tax=Mycena belliarum TaxID=1033014 RepID=A0AAD6XHI4_9AGAR|nr:P-loop containing nucleoside triphosphate hydrolase protein [Mycena belliae]
MACANDNAFGPVSQCRFFDFTIYFESYILSVILSAVLIGLGLLRIVHLARLPNAIGTNGKVFYGLKVLLALALVAADATSLAKSPESPDTSARVAASLGLVSSLFVALLSHFEHWKTRRSSILLPLYLLATVLCDIARVRTFALLSTETTPFLATLCASLAVRTCMNVTENIGKAWLIDRELSPEETAPFVSRLVFGWMVPLLMRGARSQLTLENLGPISDDFDSLRTWAAGSRQWERLRTRKHPLLRTLVHAFPYTLLAPVLPTLVFSLAQMAQPVAIHDAIDFLASYSTPSPRPVQEGWALAVAFLLIYAVSGIADGWYMLASNRASTVVRGFLIEAIYRKALTCHVEVAKELGSGKTGNMMSVESEKIVARMTSVYQPLSILVLGVLGCYQLYQQIGLSFLATLVGCVILMAAPPLLARDVGAAQTDWTARTEHRQKLTASVLRNIVPGRLMAYTDAFYKMIRGARDSELEAYRSFWRRTSRVLVLSNWGAEFLSLVTIGTYAIVALVDSSAPQFTTARMFTVIAIVNLIGMPISELGEAFAYMVQAWVSVKRVESFLLSEDQPFTTPAPAGADTVFSNASFGHGNAVFLHDLTARLPARQLTMIIGHVGCGKSTLLHAALGEVTRVGGALTIPDGATAYCAQDAWLRTESVRAAITFVAPFDAAWYRTVLRALALERDLKVLRDGDATLTTQLSGGQRQRVALARAVYSRAERYVLDDVFSALDAGTEALVWDALFQPERGLLRGKTVLLATHGIHRLEKADYIVMLADGRIVQQGADLLEHAGPTLELVQKHVKARHENEGGAPADEEPDAAHADDVVEDELGEGKRETVGASTYAFYLGVVGRFRAALYLALCAVASLVPLGINIYQNDWTSSLDDRARLVRYFGGYVALEGVAVIAIAAFVYYATGVAMPRGAAGIHARLLDSVLRAPLTVIEAAGVGKILNRFSSDLNIIDVSLPIAIMGATQIGLAMLGSLVVITVTTPWIGLLILGIVIFFTIVQYFYTKTSAQLRRLDLGSRTPLYNLLTDTVDADGIRTLRAFQCQQHFTDINSKRIQASQRPFFLLKAAQRWFVGGIKLSVALINAALICFAVGLRHSTSAGLFAVALIQATSLTERLNWFFITWVEVEICVVAAERIKEFVDWAPEEGPAPERKNTPSVGSVEKEKETEKNEQSWPQRGEIVFDGVIARYRPELQPALRDMSFHISAGERVGVVGRTGSGKSTLLATLFRKINIEKGRILVDDLDISGMQLDMLRGGMTLIPQDPVLLEISVRDNLDIEGKHSDAEIWRALELSSMKTLVERLPFKLEEVVAGSSRFSRGQKQLLALARALLRDRNIVCLDEATSSIDVETDQAIQQTLRASFQGTTIITIAHRISTVRDYDRILVLDDGQVVENGSPDELLEIPGGIFSRLLLGEETQDNRSENQHSESTSEILNIDSEKLDIKS